MQASYNAVRQSETKNLDAHSSSNSDLSGAPSSEYDDRMGSRRHFSSTSNNHSRGTSVMRNHEPQHFSAGTAVASATDAEAAGRVNYYSIEGEGEFEETDL